MPDPLDIAAVIAQTESGTNSQRMRFEPALYGAWTNLDAVKRPIAQNIMRANACSTMTAAMIACTSWGKYQMLGENLYDVCACAKNVFAFCADDFEQKFCLTTFLARRNVNFTLGEIQTDPAKREKFIAAYNGPGNTAAYWGQMQDAIKALGGAVDGT